MESFLKSMIPLFGTVTEERKVVFLWDLHTKTFASNNIEKLIEASEINYIFLTCFLKEIFFLKTTIKIGFLLNNPFLTDYWPTLELEFRLSLYLGGQQGAITKQRICDPSIPSRRLSWQIERDVKKISKENC